MRNIIDIIVPVYRGLLETRRCLESVLVAGVETPYELVVVDDCSPELELVTYLDSLVGGGAITRLKNDQNLGFAGAVNRGMKLHPDRDVLLLNSDTQVNGNWLDRLHRCAYADATIGTVTPFSNNATICSYPKFCKSNALPKGWNLADIDNIFAQANFAQWHEIPTAVGFCMFIRRACIKEIGYFDEKRFSKGYGEENDFSLRATQAGWKNVLCADVYVFHEGERSFLSDGPLLRIEASRVLRQLHPHYESLIQDFILLDPIRHFRSKVCGFSAIKALEAEISSNIPAILHIVGIQGGGVIKHVNDMTCQRDRKKYRQLILHLGNDVSILEIPWYRAYIPLCHNFFESIRSINTLLFSLGIVVLHGHSLSDKIICFFKNVTQLPVGKVFTLHDLLFDDPYILTPNKKNTDKKGIDHWRGNVRAIFSSMKFIIAPSNFIAARFNLIYNNQELTRVISHGWSSNLMPSKIDAIKNHDSIENQKPVVAVVGAIGAHKGLGYLDKLIHCDQNYSIEWVLIGIYDESVGVDLASRCSIHGYYDDDELPILLDKYKVNLVYFPLAVPESFCYSLSGVWAAGYPVAAHEIGALGERVAQHIDGNWLIPSDATPDDTFKIMTDILTSCSVYYEKRDNARRKGLSWVHDLDKTTKEVEKLWDYAAKKNINYEELGHLQELIRTQLDEECFRKTYKWMISELKIVRDVSEKRAIWINKLEKDIVDQNNIIKQITDNLREIQEQNILLRHELDRFSLRRFKSYLVDVFLKKR